MARYTTVLRTPEQVAKYKEDRELIMRIAQRANKELSYDMVDVGLALTGCHLLCCQLELQELLEYDAMNFVHDIVGIMKHIEFEHYQLQNCFLPRCAKEQ